jgi:hypothetical protein
MLGIFAGGKSGHSFARPDIRWSFQGRRAGDIGGRSPLCARDISSGSCQAAWGGITSRSDNPRFLWISRWRNRRGRQLMGSSYKDSTDRPEKSHLALPLISNGNSRQFVIIVPINGNVIFTVTVPSRRRAKWTKRQQPASVSSHYGGRLLQSAKFCTPGWRLTSSDIPADLNLRGQIARINRSIAENREADPGRRAS